MINKRESIENLLISTEQKLYWQFVVSRVSEYIQTGFKGRIVIDLQAGRINSIADQALIAGVSQIHFYSNKID